MARKIRSAIERRDFLKAGGAGLAGLASSRYLPGLSIHSAQQGRNAPDNPVILRSPQLELVLDRQNALPFQFRLPALKTTMRGEDTGGKIGITLCRLEPWTFKTASAATPTWVESTSSQSDFRFDATFDGQSAAAFTVRYVVEDSTVFVTLEDIVEQPGYELIDVAMPRLATIREEDGPAWLAHGDSGGAVVALDEAKNGQLALNTFWGNVLASLPVVMLGTERVICVQEVTAFMNGTELTVSGEPEQRRAALGTVHVHRVNGSLCWDLNLGQGKPRNCGNNRTPNLLVEQTPACRLDFVGDLDGDGAVNWLDGAKLVRSRMPAIPTHYYDDKLLFEIGLDRPSWPASKVTTFADAIKPIQNFAALTDNMPSVVQLWGWQYRGTDTGYPAVAEVNARVGTYGDMIRLMAEARQYNSTVTLSDNYDDAYQSSPAWDPAIIARRPDGGLWESRNWSGEDSYIIGMAKYMRGSGGPTQGPGIERTAYTCKRYRLRDTIYVDVLTYYSIRNDWDHQYPASGYKNLVEGRYRVLDEFKAFGVDVMSEALRYAFIGKVSHFGYAQQPLLNPFSEEPLPDPFGGENVPMLAAIYRKSAIWGRSGKTKGPLDTLLDMFFFNGGQNSWQMGESFTSDPQVMTDWVYIYTLPWMKVRSLDVETFRRDGQRTVIGLEGGGNIDLDWQNRTYSVNVGGVEIARDSSTFCSVDDSRIAFYSLQAKQLSAPIPKAWDAQRIAAVALSLEKPQEVPVSAENGRIRVSVPARQPVMVYRNGAEAKRRLLGA
jgi:Endo-alpha-N-acetylgalactosaminidase